MSGLGRFMGVVAGRSAASGGRAFLWTDAAGRRQASWHVPVLIWLLPAVFALGTAAMVAEALIKTRLTVPTTGTVVRVYDWDGDYSPVYRYVWTDGTETEATAGLRDASWNFAIGSTHPIRYFPDEKRDVVLEGPHNWTVARVIGVITLFLLPFSAYAQARVNRWRRAGAAPAA